MTRRHIDLQQATTPQLNATRRAMQALLKGQRANVSRTAREVFTETLHAAMDELATRPEYNPNHQMTRLDGLNTIQAAHIANTAKALAEVLEQQCYGEALESMLWSLYYEAHNLVESRKTLAFVDEYRETLEDDTQEMKPVR